ncbi:hypothetical protein ACETRX_18720 [Labrys portucalensis]|uniref:YkuD domain-containing protein n=1 Tax=Labrys neptuniae TaxID=376174 RepID=A0ABV6ZHK5_9HYPH
MARLANMLKATPRTRRMEILEAAFGSRFGRPTSSVRPKSRLAKGVGVACLFFGAAIAGGSSGALAAGIPSWLMTYVGEGQGQIALPVLQRARALYIQKASQGAISNPCYFAMDATRPNDPGSSGGRFYIICESQHSFRAISAGHGGGRNLRGVADFSNGRRCARHFGNAQDSELTTGGSYVTAETKTSFKGYYRVAANQDAAFLRSFIQFDGVGETANARQRAIGGHAAVALKGVCLRKAPSSPYANQDGYVPFGKLVDYAGGRSNGCTSWSLGDVKQILSMVKDYPTTLYIYPEAADVSNVARAVAAGQSPARAGLYWNAACLREIGAPKYWSRQVLEPVLAQYKLDHPAPPPRPTPICEGSE